MTLDNPDYVNMLKKMYPEKEEQNEENDDPTSPSKLKKLAKEGNKAKTPGAARTQSPVTVVR